MRHLRNLAFFVFGLMISALLLSPYAFAITVPAKPQDVVGPFSPYPPYSNPYTSDTFTRDWPASTSGTSTGADITRQGTTSVTTPSGTKVQVPVSVKSSVTKAQIAKAATRAARFNPAGIAAGIIIPALIEEGIKRCANNELGDWCKDDKEYPDIPPEFKWTIAGNTSQFYTSAQGACDQMFANQSVAFPPTHYNLTIKQTSQTSYDCMVQPKDGGAPPQRLGSSIAMPVCPSGYREKVLINGDTYCTKAENPVIQRPASEPEMEEATKKGQDKDPSRSPGFADGARRDGHSPDSPSFGGAPTQWTAPPVTTAPRQTGQSTTQNADGSSVTTTKTTKEVVTPKTEGSTSSDTRITHYNITNITTTTIVNNATNQQTIIEDRENGSDEPNDPDEVPNEDEDLSFNDPSMPDVPKLYTQKYPDGIAGAWRDNKPDIQSTQFWAGIRSMFPEMGSGGSCPNFALSFGIGNLANFGTMPFDVPCWIYQAIGLIMLTTAAFCARKIIF